MQSNKTPKKSLKKADETAVPAPEKATAEASTKPRSLRSSRTKKTEVVETGSGKHHHKPPPAAGAEATSSAAAVKQRAISAAAGSLVDPIASVLPSRVISRQHIAELAYFYWEGRGRRHGSSEEDWLRAEQELLGVFK